jgi:hypothetical protein
MERALEMYQASPKVPERDKYTPRIEKDRLDALLGSYRALVAAITVHSPAAHLPQSEPSSNLGKFR